MKLCELHANNQTQQIAHLAGIVARWTTNVHETSSKERTVISKFASMFPYSGSMYRLVFYFDRGQVQPNITFANLLLRHPRGRGQASWSKTLVGVNKWRSQLPDDIDFRRGDKALYILECSQHGTAFDVSKLLHYVKQHNLTIPNPHGFSHDLSLSLLERAIFAEEVIAPYYNNLHVKVDDVVHPARRY
jgi:hypothetical protein